MRLEPDILVARANAVASAQNKLRVKEERVTAQGQLKSFRKVRVVSEDSFTSL